MQIRPCGSKFQTTRVDSCNLRLELTSHSMSPLLNFVNIQKSCSTSHHYKVKAVQGVTFHSMLHRLAKERVFTKQMEKVRHQRAKGIQHQVFKFRMIAKFLLMESSCANVGKWDDAQPKLSQASVAWLGITCAGRRHVTSCTRAMSAPTDLSLTGATTVSLWRPQLLKFVVAQLVCQTL